MSRNRQDKAAKRAKRVKAKSTHQQMRRLSEQRAERLVAECDSDELLERLTSIVDRDPNDGAALDALLDVLSQGHGWGKYCLRVRKWLDRHPRDAQRMWKFVLGAIQLGMLGTAQHALITLKTLGPEPEMRPLMVEVEGLLAEDYPKMLEALGLGADEELVFVHESIICLMAAGELDETIKVATQAIVRWPDCVPLRNNLIIALFALGEDERVLAECDACLTSDPHSVYALSHKARSLYLLGRDEAVDATLVQMLECQSLKFNRWAKQAEALMTCGRDQQLVELMRQVEQVDSDQDDLDEEAHLEEQSLLRHLAAVAHSRLGDQKSARRLWQAALALTPSFEAARENLADQLLPVDQQTSAWSWDIAHWIPEQWIGHLLKQSGASARMLMDQHPRMWRVLEVLLDQSDQIGRKMAISTCKELGDERAIGLLEKFARSPRGPLEQRIDAAAFLRQRGRLPPGPFTFIANGKPKEMMLMGWEITYESMHLLSDDYQDLHNAAYAAQDAGDFESALKLWQQAIDLHPESATTHFNYATALFAMGQDAQAREMVQEIHAKNPDYTFARCMVAQWEAEAGRVTEALDMLNPIMSKPKMHAGELRMLCSTHVVILLIRGDVQAAKSWLQILEQYLPGDILLEELKERIQINTMPGFSSSRPGKRIY